MLDSVISYNRSTPLGAIYYDQAVFLHMQNFFDDFVTVTRRPGTWLEDFNLEHTNLTVDIPDLEAENAKLASSPEFAAFVKGQPKRKYILYQPLSPPYVVNPLIYIMNSPTIAHAYEHKRYFRDEFAELITMPEHVVRRLEELDDAMHNELEVLFGNKFVIQDVESFGSKGTHIVSNKEQYDRAVKTLNQTSFSGSVVVSEFIDGQPYSVQVCVTKYGIFTGGLQRQLIDSKYLCNPDLPGATRWCGGELGGNPPEILKHRTQEIATVVGSELASHGYRGIFGIDLLITPNNDVYAIEINARLTGYTHILSDMQFAKGKIPFSLLHTLELGNLKYEVDDLEALPTMNSVNDPYSYLILNNFRDTPLEFKKDITSGIYEYGDDGEIHYVTSSYRIGDLENDRQFILFSSRRKGDTVEAGKRILKIIKPGRSMDEVGEIDEPHQKLVEAIKRYFEIEF